MVDGEEGKSKSKKALSEIPSILPHHRGDAFSSGCLMTLSAHSAPSRGRASPASPSTGVGGEPRPRRWRRIGEQEEWSDTPSHEGNLLLHPSAGNEWTPVGDSLNGLICN